VTCPVCGRDVALTAKTRLIGNHSDPTRSSRNSYRCDAVGKPADWTPPVPAERGSYPVVNAGAVYVIAKTFRFAAAHHLKGLPTGHKCARPHGHTYTVEVRLASERLDSTGFVADYAELDAVQSYIDAELDHRDLNETLPVQPSCECIAKHLYCWCRDHLAVGHLVVAVRVAESPSTWAEYRADVALAESAGERW
jgi:6-pyruvoyltetrahydropterin/6-carboxytetrahydropterin synthase